MSKASEWAKLQLPELSVADINVSISHKWDNGTRLPVPLALIQRNMLVGRTQFFASLTPEDAVALGRWLLDHFAEASHEQAD